MRFVLVLAALALAVPAFAEPVAKVYGAANLVTFDGAADLPSDLEAGLNGRLSLTPHVSVVGAAYYGFDNSYLRGQGGLRVTATDVDNPNFSIGIGIQYQVCSDEDIRPRELAPDVSIGWKPWPVAAPKVVVGVQGSYGLDSNQAGFLVAVRYHLFSFWEVQ